MAAPNIVNVASIIGKTAVVTNVATGGSTVLSAPTTGHVHKLNSLRAVNKTALAAWITVAFVRSATSYYLAYQISVPANAALVIVDKDSGLYLEETDSITATAGTATAIDIEASYEDIS